MKKDLRIYLAHILECAEKIERFTRGGREEFLREELIQDAVIRNLEIIGGLPSVSTRSTEQRILRFHGEVWRPCAMCSSISTRG
jgi:uncharacterized protein with HEPN domain